MTTKIKAVKRNNPGKSGENMYVAVAVSDGEVTLGELTSRIEQMSTVSGADIRAVIYALVDVSKELLKDGKIVRLGELGSLRIGVTSKAEDSAENVNVNSVMTTKIIFTPGEELKEMLKLLNLKMV